MNLSLTINDARTTVTASMFMGAIRGGVATFDVTTSEGRDALDVFTDTLGRDDDVTIESSAAMTRWTEYERPND